MSKFIFIENSFANSKSRNKLNGMKIINHIVSSQRGLWPSNLSSQYASWYYEACQAQWNCFADIQDNYIEAEDKTQGKVLFHILDNKAVIYVHIEYVIGRVYVRFVGTNEAFAEYQTHKKGVAS